jgi:hypothetical protein
MTTDSFALIGATTTSSDGVVMFQNTVTGDLIKAPMPELPKLGIEGARPPYQPALLTRKQRSRD